MDSDRESLEFVVRVNGQIVAACLNMVIGRAAYDAAVQRATQQQVTLRHRARIIAWHNRPADK